MLHASLRFLAADPAEMAVEAQAECQFRRHFGRRGQKVLIGYDPSHQSQFRGAPGVERQSQQDQLCGPDVPDPRRKRAARSKFRRQREIDEGHAELRALAGVHEVTVRQHGRAPSDGGAVDGGDDRLVEIDQRIHQPSLRRVSRPRRVVQKILDIVAGAERVSCAVPERDTRALVPGRVDEDVCESHVHARGHRVPLGRAVQFNAKDAFGMLGHNLVHRLPPALWLGRNAQPCSLLAISAILRP